MPMGSHWGPPELRCESISSEVRGVRLPPGLSGIPLQFDSIGLRKICVRIMNWTGRHNDHLGTIATVSENVSLLHASALRQNLYRDAIASCGWAASRWRPRRGPGQCDFLLLEIFEARASDVRVIGVIVAGEECLKQSNAGRVLPSVSRLLRLARTVTAAIVSPSQLGCLISPHAGDREYWR
jgi:hypothetical protein